MDLFPRVVAAEVPKLIESLALPYRHFEANDLEHADALLAVIETLERPDDPSEAVEDLVRSVMLIAVKQSVSGCD